MHPLADQYVERQPDHLQALLEQTRQYIMAALPQVSEQFKFGCPFYVYCGWLCYVYVRKGKIVWGFCRGTALSNEGGLLYYSGAKDVAHIYVENADIFNSEALALLLQEAALLNEQRQAEREKSRRVKR